HRLHQEDFNQALGASGAEKYQEHGGKVSLGRVAAVTVNAQGRQGLEQLLTLVTLSVAVGNLDMHAKNISLLHPADGSSRLAPAYDVVPLTHYAGIDGRMAMAINDVYEHSRIRRSDLIAEAGRWGMGAVRAGDVVDATVEAIRSTVQHEAPHARAVPGLPDLIDSLAARIGDLE
ncbi:MAG: type II toxin-antitoxin system HipA family toxin, partial [Candidatus Nanopelagicales bacterium]